MRIGLVGAGAIARRHASLLRTRPGIEITVVCDSDAERAATLAHEVGAESTTDWESALASDELDVAFICTPPGIHAGPAIAGLERGLAVYLEKPLARSLDDGRRIVDAWKRSDAVCAVGYQWRSLELLTPLRAALAGVVPGMLVSRSYGGTEPGRDDRAAAGAGPSGSWFLDPARSGGILFELASHDIDLQRALAGPVLSVQGSAASGLLALAGTPATALDDAIALTLRFASGALGSVLVAWTDAQDPPLYTLDLLGTGIALELRCEPAFRLDGRAHGKPVAETGKADPRESALDRFLEAVLLRDRARVPCTPADAFGTLATAIACEQAIASGETVAVPAL